MVIDGCLTLQCCCYRFKMVFYVLDGNIEVTIKYTLVH